MPFGEVKLNDGSKIAFGTGSSMKDLDVTEYVEQALENGFSHIDTAQYYGTEQYIGQALKHESLSRSDFFVTTKYDGKGKVVSSLEESLKKLGLTYVDLYLIHNPRGLEGTLENTWREMERAKEAGLTKSIGVSNFSKSQLQELLKTAKVTPAANQIKLHPYNWADQRETVKFAQGRGIAIEAYSPLTPITSLPGGSLDPVLDSIGKRLDATPAQVIFAWLRSKGAVIITTTRKVPRLEEYLGAGDLPPLSDSDIAAIESATPPSPPLASRFRISPLAVVPPPPPFSFVTTSTENSATRIRQRLASPQVWLRLCAAIGCFLIIRFVFLPRS